MSDTQLETVNQVIKDIVANRKNLADQVEVQKQQVEVGIAQLAKFDSLIAVLRSPATHRRCWKRHSCRRLRTPPSLLLVSPQQLMSLPRTLRPNQRSLLDKALKGGYKNMNSPTRAWVGKLFREGRG